MERMLIPLLETVVDPDGFCATTRDGQLRSDLVRLVGRRADRCRVWEKKPAGDPFTGRDYWEGPLTPEKIAALSENRSGRWNYYGAQFFWGDKLLFSAGRQGTELFLFHLPKERAEALKEELRAYVEVTDVRIFPMPEEVLARWSKQIH